MSIEIARRSARSAGSVSDQRQLRRRGARAACVARERRFEVGAIVEPASRCAQPAAAGPPSLAPAASRSAGRSSGRRSRSRCRGPSAAPPASVGRCRSARGDGVFAAGDSARSRLGSSRRSGVASSRSSSGLRSSSVSTIGVELDIRQLQQPDRLLQLRRHHQPGPGAARACRKRHAPSCHSRCIGAFRLVSAR